MWSIRRRWLRASFLHRLPCAVASVFVAACSFQAARVSGDDGVDGGGAVMGGCAWAVHFDACELPVAPTQDLVLNAPTRWTFNTDGMGSFGSTVPAGGFAIRKLLQTGGGGYVIVLYTSAFTLAAGATLDVTGDKGLVIAANSTIKIGGELDAGSHSTTGPPTTGPGASDNAITCVGGLKGGAGGSGDSADGGGGGGGALAANGGQGGVSNNGGAGGGAGVLVSLPPFIRAGCAGGAGGGMKNGDKGGEGGRGGDGGGAIELAARDSITVTGRINAGGGGGQGGKRSAGGGGAGGSGGIISFHAPTVTLESGSVIAANGGGGGAGALDDKDGGDGDDALMSAISAGGGSIDNGGNPGGDGAASTTAAATGMGSGSGGGGGGGGSVGYLMVRAGVFTPAGTVSPPVTKLKL
jgi:hypothetical protein